MDTQIPVTDDQKHLLLAAHLLSNHLTRLGVEHAYFLGLFLATKDQPRYVVFLLSRSLLSHFFFPMRIRS